MADNSHPKSPENDQAAKEQEEKPSSASSRKKSPLSRVPSALTVENLKKHEEETDALNVVELMSKNGEEDENLDHFKSSIESSDEDVRSGAGDVVLETNDSISPDRRDSFKQEERIVLDDEKAASDGESEGMKKEKDETEDEEVDHVSIPDPIALREEVRGFKLSGEEYIAISIDVQTDESYLAEYFEYNVPEQGNEAGELSESDSRPAVVISATDSSRTTSQRRRRKHITSDLSTTEIRDEESVLHITKSGESEKTWKESDVSIEPESEAEDDNVVTEIAESAESETLTHETHETTQTLPSVGPPFILQYKAESKMIPIDYKDVEVAIPDNLSLEDLTEEQREYYGNIMEDMRKIQKEKSEARLAKEDLISIQPHSAYGSRQERKLAKDRERERSRMREMKMQSRQAAGGGGASGQMMANQTNFYAFARQLKTVNYSLSSEKCMEEGWTVRPVTPKTPEELPPEVYVYDPMQDVISGKRFHRTFVQKFHLNGRPFLAVFPDGTGNVWYQSGNVAISIIATEKVGKLTFIVHDDIPLGETENIRAVFEPSGHCTCYYPTGVIRMLLTHLGGQYFNPKGERVKKWLWRDQQTHVHAPPFQPITFSLSKKIGVRVTAQEAIFLTFTDGSRSVRFNAGTRLRLKPSLLLPTIEPLDPDLVLLNEKRHLIQSIVERVNNNLKFPNSPRLKKLKLPNYLTTQLEKSIKTREQLLLQEQQIGDTGGMPKKKRSAISSRKSSETAFKPQNIPKRRLNRLPRYPKVGDIPEFEEVKPIVIVN